jgi:hypothetical protein
MSNREGDGRVESTRTPSHELCSGILRKTLDYPKGGLQTNDPHIIWTPLLVFPNEDALFRRCYP